METFNKLTKQDVEQDGQNGLKMLRCKKCQTIQYFNRKMCIKCRNTEFESIEIEPHGVLISNTTLFALPSCLKHKEKMIFGIIELRYEDQKIRILAQLASDSKSNGNIGDKVKIGNQTVSIQENGEEIKGEVYYVE